MYDAHRAGMHWEDAAVQCVNITAADIAGGTTAPVSAQVAFNQNVLTSPPTSAPTYPDEVGVFACDATHTTVASSTQGCEIEWRKTDVVYREDVGAGYGSAPYDPFYNSNPLRHLNFPIPSTINLTLGYWVRIEWGASLDVSTTTTAAPSAASGVLCDHVTFYVPAGSDVFKAAIDKHIVISNVTCVDHCLPHTRTFINALAHSHPTTAASLT